MPSSRQVVSFWLFLAGLALPCSGLRCSARRHTWAIGRGPTFIWRPGQAWWITSARWMKPSDRVLVRTLGESTEGRPYVVAVVSSPDTIKDLPKYQKLQRQLSHPGSLSATTSETADRCCRE